MMAAASTHPESAGVGRSIATPRVGCLHHPGTAELLPSCPVRTPSCSSTENSSQYWRSEQIRSPWNSAIVTPCKVTRMPVGSMRLSSASVTRAGVSHVHGPLDARVVAADIERHDVQLDVGERIVAAIELVDQLAQRRGRQCRRPRSNVIGEHRLRVSPGRLRSRRAAPASTSSPAPRSTSSRQQLRLGRLELGVGQHAGPVELAELLQIVHRVACRPPAPPARLGESTRTSPAAVGCTPPAGCGCAAGRTASTSGAAGTGTTCRGTSLPTTRGSSSSAPGTRRR